MKFRLFLLLSLPFGSLELFGKTSISAKIDCQTYVGKDTPSTQSCATLRTLKLGYEFEASPKITLKAAIDPLGTPATNRKAKPILNEDYEPTIDDRSTGILEEASLIWKFRNSLHFNVAIHDSATNLPDQNYLPNHGLLQSPQWQQLALKADYQLALLEGAEVSLIIGNGEGEITRNLDAQQYGAFSGDVEFYPGIHFKTGISFDGNNKGSEAFQWLYQPTDSDLGFSTERLSAIFYSRGDMESYKGLSFTLGWQKTKITDLAQDKVALSDSTSFDGSVQIDPAYLLAESTERTAEITHIVSSIDVAYRILDQYEIALGYQSRNIKISEPVFTTCSEIIGGVCSQQSQGTTSLTQSQTGVAVSNDFEEGFRLTIDYSILAYDKLYNVFNYQSTADKKVKSLDVVNVRLTYGL